MRRILTREAHSQSVWLFALDFPANVERNGKQKSLCRN